MTGPLTLNSSSGEKGKEQSEYLLQKHLTDKQADKKTLSKPLCLHRDSGSTCSTPDSHTTYWPCCKTHNCNFGIHIGPPQRSRLRSTCHMIISSLDACQPQSACRLSPLQRMWPREGTAGCATTTTTKTELQKQQTNGRQTKRQTHRADYGKNGGKKKADKTTEEKAF